MFSYIKRVNHVLTILKRVNHALTILNLLLLLSIVVIAFTAALLGHYIRNGWAAGSRHGF